jgi:polysaccharide chain length determinant protein (PEP-CTERM system associated)
VNSLADLDISTILNSLYRRKSLIVSVFLVVSALAMYLSTVIPEVYRSTTLISVSPQRIPTSYVSTTITTSLGERMQAIAQEILSRTRLEKIIQEFELYPDTTTVEDRVERLRKVIKIEFRQANLFALSFESESPQKAKEVATRLASLFIEQNLQVREQQAMGTKSFINAEAERLRNELEEQETVVSRYRIANRFELPDQLDTNLRMLDQLRSELQGSNVRLSALQERKGILQKQIVESDILGGFDLLGLPQGGQSTPYGAQLELKKRELESLLARYSLKHPDVARLNKEIEAIESQKTSSTSKTSAGSSIPATNPLRQVLQSQVADLDNEIRALRSQIDNVRGQIPVYQARIDNTSVRGIELTKISRTYDITLRKYQDLLAKGLESQLSENLEKKQKGEQFDILDPANFPIKPLRPNRPMIILLGLMGGLAGGILLAFVWDTLDTSFKRADEIAGVVNLPVLATIPSLMTRGSVLDQRRSQGILVFASIAALAVGLVCVRMFGPLYF